MNKNKKQTIIIFPIIIVVIISILVSIVFVFNNTNTIDYESKLEEAQKYVDEMDYKKAEIAYLEAIEIDSKQAKAYIELADIYELNNQNEKVAEVLNKAKKTVSSNYKYLHQYQFLIHQRFLYYNRYISNNRFYHYKLHVRHHY